MTIVSNPSGLYLGVDIGGTKVAFGVVNSSGKILTQGRTPMPASGTAEEGLAAVLRAIDTALVVGPIQAIGICAPGPLDPSTGIVFNPPNLPCWRNFPLADRVSARYSLPVKIDNDANAAALAETRWGAARGYGHVFYATIGTGIGTGIVLEGRIYHGNTGSAGEGGHMSIDHRGPVCSCGKRGCIEALAAGPAIVGRARMRLSASPPPQTTILSLAKNRVASVTCEMVGQAYAAGDALAREILQETVDLLVPWLGNIVDMLDPDVLVIGGGVAAMLKPFFPEMKTRLPDWCINPHASNIPLVMVRYGADAGIAGGAASCSDSTKRK